MEKFGIFELLDALSAMTEAPKEEAQGAQAETPPKRPDASFAAPAYGAAPPPAQETEQSALDSFLARHDALAKRAKK